MTKDTEHAARIYEDINHFITAKLQVEIQNGTDAEQIASAIINLSTTMASMALFTVKNEDRKSLLQNMQDIIMDKLEVAENYAVEYETMIRARAASFTCRPTPPTKH